MKRNGEPAPPDPLADTCEYVLRLYVTGMTAHSVEAVANLKAFCEEYLAGRYDLEVIDLYQQPQRAKGERIVAAPTLVKQLPLPPRRVAGTLSQTDRVRESLGIAADN